MDMENGQSSSPAVVKMIPSSQENEMTKLVAVRKGVETQIKLVEEFLQKRNETTSCFLKTIATIIKRSKEQENIDKNVTIGQSVSTNSKSIEISDVEQLKRFVNSVKGAVEAFSILKDEEGDENLVAILYAINFILRNSNIPLGSEVGDSSSLSPKNTNHHGNLIESDSKRQKVISDAESNEEIEELYTTEKNPLEIDVVLKNLFKYCCTKDLFQFRSTSRKWNDMATSSLKQRDYFLTLSYNSGEKIYKKSNSTSATLNQLNDILSTSKDSPLVNFKFINGYLGSSEAQGFFKTHGEKIKKLRFDLNMYRIPNIPATSITTFRRILLAYAKNIQELDLLSIENEWSEDSSPQLFPEPKNMIQLPKLTSLKLHYSFTNEKSYRLAQDLIQAAVNLKTIEDYNIEFLDPTATAFENKIHAVKKIAFHPKAQNLNLYSKFAEGKPKLEQIDIFLDNNNTNNNDQLKKVCKILQNIFEASKDSLKSILNCPTFSHLPSFKFPAMKNVNDINFTDAEEDTRDKLKWVLDFQGTPRPMKLAQIFPSLQLLITDFQSPKDSELWLNYFDYSQPLHSVKDLQVLQESCPLFVEKLATLFPAVEELKVYLDPLDFRQTMPLIWKGFSNVKDLTLQINNYGMDEIILEQMDSGITGFSPETCVQLKQNSRNMKLEDIEALRENPSIFNATKLSTFKIEFNFYQDEDVYSRPIFSIVTGIFGFDLAKKRSGVKVEFSFDGEVDTKRALSEISHYVNNED